jgi:hypothetical protein
MTGHDFVDFERRKLKAGKIGAKLRAEGMTADLVVACAADTKWLRQVERDAGVAKSSDATWALAVQDLARRPPTFEQDRRPGCGCHVDPDTGVLYEFPGWACPHGSAEHPGPIDPAVANAVARVEALAEFEREQRTPKAIEIPPVDMQAEVDAMDWDV